MPPWISNSAANVAAGLTTVGKTLGGWISSTWTGMSPEARAFCKGLGIGFTLGAFVVWWIA